MFDLLRDVSRAIFRFEVILIALIIGVFSGFLYFAIQSSTEYNRLSETCTAKGLVIVRYDNINYCTDIKNLQKF